MATKKYKCTNFAACDLALSKEIIEIEEGEEIVCPGCHGPNSLAPLDPRPRNGPGDSIRKKALVGAAAVAALGLLTWVFWPSSPNPELANAMLSDFFPALPK